MKKYTKIEIETAIRGGFLQYRQQGIGSSQTGVIAYSWFVDIVLPHILNLISKPIALKEIEKAIEGGLKEHNKETDYDSQLEWSWFQNWIFPYIYNHLCKE